MSISTTTYVRKPIYVDAVQVTEQNFEELAVWCGGEIKEGLSLRNKPIKFIHVPVTHPQNERQEQARVGDWILTSVQGYKVYTPKAFSVAFDKVNAVPTKTYPYPDGDTLVLGPEIFASIAPNSADLPDEDTVIAWKGENFYTLERASALLNENDSATEVNPQQGVLGDSVDGPPAVGTLPMPEQPMPSVDPDSTPDANLNPNPPVETPKAADVWARVEKGEITDVQARELLGLPEPIDVAAVAATEEYPAFLCNTCLKEKSRDAVGEFCGECGGTVVSRDDVIAQQAPAEAVGTKPMPEQPAPTDVEDRERPATLPPHMQTGREIADAKLEHVTVVPATPENIAAGAQPLEESAITNDQGGVVHSMESPEETPEDPSTHTGVDLEQDEALKAGIDLTDESAIKASDDEAQLTADATVEDDEETKDAA